MASELRVPTTRISAIVNETRAISADTALRLGRYFSTSPEFWLHMQARFDLDIAADSSRAEIERLVQPRAAA